MKVCNMKNERQSGNLLTRRIVTWAKWLVEQVVSPGDICVDATVGNGNDTLFLAECVGTSGKVYGFDIQQTALEKTKQKLAVADVLDRVNLIQDNHANLSNYLANNSIKAVMFNLGYLPGGDTNLITEPESTIQALEASLNLLGYRGIITVASYRGHPGALEEYAKVNILLSKLNPTEYNVLRLESINHANLPPVLFVAQKY
ncbi:MAG: class I SAM-dependent methyltransferase [Syntrophaceticus sp.]|nr:class I SAM-dependent methyltransferase [Syntrophaceticus sp.]